MINYHKKKFRGYENYDDGDFDQSVIFEFDQKEDVVKIRFIGDNITLGIGIGKVVKNGFLTYTYQYISKNLNLNCGICMCRLNLTENGLYKLDEEWETFFPLKQKGNSSIIEILK